MVELDCRQVLEGCPEVFEIAGWDNPAVHQRKGVEDETRIRASDKRARDNGDGHKGQRSNGELSYPVMAGIADRISLGVE